MTDELYTLRFTPSENGWIVEVERGLVYTPPEVYLCALRTALAAELEAHRQHVEEMQEICRRN